MASKASGRERCIAGQHSPAGAADIRTEAIRRSTCRYCGRPIMRTQATRIWFLAGMLTDGGGAAVQPPISPPV